MTPHEPDVREDEIAALFRFLGRDDTLAHVRLRRWTRRARVVRALKGLLGCWLAAIAAIFLPVLHFILVPALLLGGPVFALSRWIEGATLLAARGPCPGCGSQMSHTVAQRASARTTIRCDHCARTVELLIPAAALAPPAT